MWHQWFNRHFTKLRYCTTWNENSVSAWCSCHRTAYVVYLQWYSPKWRYKVTRRRLIVESYFSFLCVQKVISYLHKITVEPLIWIILLMSLLCFWTLIVVITLMFIGGSESSQNSAKISKFVFWRWTEIFNNRNVKFGWNIFVMSLNTWGIFSRS